MGVALRGAGMGVPEQALHHVERDPLIDQEARIGVPQIVQPHVGEAGAPADTVPREEQRGGRLAVDRGGEDVRVVACAGSRAAAPAPGR